MLQLYDATDVEYDGQSSDSWTLGTSSGSSLEEDFEFGGGEKEEAPNNRCGGSSPVASHLWFPSPISPARPIGDDEVPRIAALQIMQANLSQHVRDEMALLDATSGHQHLWMPILTEAILQKIQIEEDLLGFQRESIELKTQKLEEEFLVTKTISSKEVWDNLPSWEQSIKAEHRQLVHGKEAVIQISREELYRMAEEQRLPIELLPAKMVHTRKAHSGAYRSRAVICGNFESQDANACKYAGGADAVQARALIRTAAQEDWCIAGSDVRVAFLNAPRRDKTKLVACEIPSVMKRLGLADEDSVWLVSKALYGLTTSPRDWGIHRDQTVPKILWKRTASDGVVWKGRFVKSGDDNTWRLIEVQDGSTEERWVGLLAVYADDLLISAPREVTQAAMEALATTWAISEVEYASSTHALRFCGFEIQANEDGNGFHLHQQMYEKELLARWPIDGSLSVPVFKVSEEDEEAKEFQAQDLATAQALTGALLWLSTRTRPELMHGVATMSRLLSKNPKKAVEIGYVLLKFIRGCPGGLHYTKGPPSGPWAARQQLKVKRHDRLLEVFADIAYGAGANFRSVQGIIIYLGGVPIAWQSNQQPFVTHSTAEAELVSYCEALQAGKATEAMLCAIYGQTVEKNDFERIIYGDNLAAIGLAHGNTAASWRTRHLRIRINVMKEALDGDENFPGGIWQLLHLKGTELVADGLTKPLLGQAFFRFLQDLGVKRPEVEPLGDLQSSQSQPDGGNWNGAAAVMTLLLGSSLLSQAEAGDIDETLEEDGSDAIWICGVCLMVLGAVSVGQLVHSLACCCIRRLRAESKGESPQLDSADFSTASEAESEDAVKEIARKRRVSVAAPKPSAKSASKQSSSRSGSSMGASCSKSSMSQSSMPQSGSGSASSMNMPRKSGSSSEQAASQGSSSKPTASRTEEGESRANDIKNPWNAFQHQHRGKGLSSQKLALMYLKEKTV